MLATMLILACSVDSGGSATVPQPRDGGHAQRHAHINAHIADRAGEVDLVFVGDSITQGWETTGKSVWSDFYGGRKAANLGISGDRTEHVLWRLDNGNLRGIAPRVAVVMIGTNNIGHGIHGTDEVLAGVQEVVKRIVSHNPDTRVLLLDIFPRGWTFNEARGRITQINQALATLHDGDRIVFLPIGHIFIEPDGRILPEIMPDALHLSEAGYRRWAEAIEPTLSNMLQTRSEHETASP